MVFPNQINDRGTIIPFDTKLDMGAGLERLCSVINGTMNNYALGEYSAIKEIIEANYSLSLDKMHKTVDHIKTSHLLLRSGLRPSNKEQGYVLRKLLRLTFDVLDVKGDSCEKFYDTYNLVGEYIEETFIREMYSSSFNEKEVFQLVKAEVEKYISLLKSVPKVCKSYGIKLESIEGLSEDTLDDIYSTSGITKKMIIDYLYSKGGTN